MATGNDQVKRKRSLEVRETKKWNKTKFILNASPSQSSDTTVSAGLLKKCKGSDVKKEKEDSSTSKPRSADDQIDDKAPSNISVLESDQAPKNKLTGSEKECEDEVLASQTEMNNCVSSQGGCLEPTSTSEQSKSLSYNIQEDDDSLRNQAAILKRKIKKLNRELREYAAICMELNDENKLIMDELKQVCQPCDTNARSQESIQQSSNRSRNGVAKDSLISKAGCMGATTRH